MSLEGKVNQLNPCLQGKRVCLDLRNNPTNHVLRVTTPKEDQSTRKEVTI